MMASDVALIRRETQGKKGIRSTALIASRGAKHDEAKNVC